MTMDPVKKRRLKIGAAALALVLVTATSTAFFMSAKPAETTTSQQTNTPGNNECPQLRATSFAHPCEAHETDEEPTHETPAPQETPQEEPAEDPPATESSEEEEVAEESKVCGVDQEDDSILFWFDNVEVWDPELTAEVMDEVADEEDGKVDWDGDDYGEGCDGTFEVEDLDEVLDLKRSDIPTDIPDGACVFTETDSVKLSGLLGLVVMNYDDIRKNRDEKAEKKGFEVESSRCDSKGHFSLETDEDTSEDSSCPSSAKIVERTATSMKVLLPCGNAWVEDLFTGQTGLKPHVFDAAESCLEVRFNDGSYGKAESNWGTTFGQFDFVNPVGCESRWVVISGY